MKRYFSFKTLSIFLIFMCGATIALFAQESPTFNAGQDPKPDGMQWALIENMSDEFNTDSLDENKWKNTDPNRWLGREPAIFKKDVATVSDGKLKLTVYQLPSHEAVNGKTWTHAGGYIGSHNPTQVGTYFEAKMKGSQTFMSSTFWVINNRSSGTDCDVRVTELDIQECIGQITTSSSWAQNKYREMGSNTHSRNAVCDETPIGSKGNKTDLGGAAYDDFFIYAAWWKSEREIQFFLNGNYIYTVIPEADFNLPMYLRMVSETYDWNPVPADGGMTGTVEERTTSYDWVRTWKLEEIPTGTEIGSEIKQLKMFPNPAQHKVQVEGLDQGAYELYIVNAQGAIVHIESVSVSGRSTAINIAKLIDGMYTLKVQNEQINEVFRFVKN